MAAIFYTAVVSVVLKIRHGTVVISSFGNDS
jgi:hypothetical protein